MQHKKANKKKCKNKPSTRFVWNKRNTDLKKTKTKHLHHWDTHLPTESNAISNWLSLPRIPFLQWSFNLQPVWLLIKLCNLKEKEQKPEVWLERGVHLSVDTFQILAPGNGSWSIRRDGPWGLLLEKQKALWWTLGHPRTCVQYALVKRY